MREIKIRGKRLDNGEWLYGNFIELRNPFNHEDSPACFIMPKEVNIADPDSIAEQEVVDPATVGQFTGLLDKNGREIYEGDIVDYISPFFRDLTYPSYPEAPVDPKHFYRCVVVWNERDCGFGLVSLKEALLKPIEQQPVGITQISDSYLIGNIHDNPELLKP